jgi:hypothetical protein
MLRFLFKCRRRLDALGFEEKSAIYVAIDTAYFAMHDLHMKLHYESCGHGVWNSSDEQSGANTPTDQPQGPPTHPLV